MLTDTELAVARAAKGFMPDDEGLALHEAGLAGGAVGPLLEIGSYCGKSGVYLGAAARERGHRAVHGRPPPRLGGEPGRVGAPRHRGRRPAHRSHGHAAVLPAHDRGRRARRRRRRRPRRLADRRPRTGPRRSASCSSTAVTPRTSRWPTTTTWAHHQQYGLLVYLTVHAQSVQAGRCRNTWPAEKSSKARPRRLPDSGSRSQVKEGELARPRFRPLLPSRSARASISSAAATTGASIIRPSTIATPPLAASDAITTFRARATAVSSGVKAAWIRATLRRVDREFAGEAEAPRGVGLGAAARHISDVQERHVEEGEAAECGSRSRTGWGVGKRSGREFRAKMGGKISHAETQTPKAGAAAIASTAARPRADSISANRNRGGAPSGHWAAAIATSSAGFRP